MWSPCNSSDIQLLESLQQTFTRRIQSVSHLNYWERLAALRLFSLQRRRERYMAIYISKILEGLVPNLNIPIKARENPRTGRTCILSPIKTTAPTYVKTLIDESFATKGPQIFNVLPKHIRNIKDKPVCVFKEALDKYLWTVHDKPLQSGYTSARLAESNSLIDRVPYVRRN